MIKLRNFWKGFSDCDSFPYIVWPKSLNGKSRFYFIPLPLFLKKFAPILIGYIGDIREVIIHNHIKRSMDRRAKVVYTAKGGSSFQSFDALDWLAQLVAHIPNKGEQMVRYYGYYSNKSRGMRLKAAIDDTIPALVESHLSSKAWRRNWAGHFGMRGP